MSRILPGLSPEQVLEHVVRPTLEYLNLPGGEAAERLVMGTAAQESKFRHIQQLGGGPAVGLWQMEPATFNDLWFRALKLERNLELRKKIEKLIAPLPLIVPQLRGNLPFAAAMCRAHYWCRPFRLEEGASAAQLAACWKEHYNTFRGAGTEGEFISNYRTFVAPLYGGR